MGEFKSSPFFQFTGSWIPLFKYGVGTSCGLGERKIDTEQKPRNYFLTSRKGQDAKMEKIIYLDNAATTAFNEKAKEAMIEIMNDYYGNASSVYSIGRGSKKRLEQARERVAVCLNCDPREVYFTGSGTEADNWAIAGYCFANKQKGNHIITTKIEHHAVLHSCEFMEKNGFEVTYLPVDEFGLVSLEELKKAIQPNTVLITIMTANNEEPYSRLPISPKSQRNIKFASIPTRYRL